ncbi:MAG TPA: c-type cytochrome [Thermoanaerobaculia bacterium]
MRRRWIAILIALALVEGVTLLAVFVRAEWRRGAESSPVGRGRAVAARMGCFACHGPEGAAGGPNPGAKGGSIPTWTGGTWMMFNKSESDVRAWIADGHPPGRQPEAAALIKMPAYKSRLRAGEIDDLVAYVLAVSAYGDLDEKPSAGRDAIARLGCFGCHGPEGRGVVANPGSFKGYIPPWDGADYPDLVQNAAELKQWVRSGVSDRFKANPAARHFVETQVVQMPAYGDKVSDADLDAIGAYIAWVRANPRGGKRK